MSKIFRKVLAEVAETEPKISLLQMVNGRKAESIIGQYFDDEFVKWWKCKVLVYRMDYLQNLLQVAVEGEPDDWGQ